MGTGLAIKKGGTWDLLSLGALVHRLDPGITPFRKASSCQIHVSGGEFNVAANLSDCFRMRTAVASAMVDYPIGHLISERVRAMGVTGIYKEFPHDGVTGPNMATVYSDQGCGIRPPVVFYNRSHEAAGLLKVGDFNWDELFSRGIRWFHSGGIFSALSPSTPGLILEAMKAAKRNQAIVSFDLNFREKLWKIHGGLAGAQKTLKEIVNHVDVLVGNEEDLQKGLGIRGPEITTQSCFDTSAFESMIREVAKEFPNIQVVATSLREVHSTNRHSWSATAWIQGNFYQAPSIQLDVYDRVGGGDGFASGLFFGLMTGKTPEESLRLGWAHGALLTTFPGDTTMATLEQVEALARGGSARIQR